MSWSFRRRSVDPGIPERIVNRVRKCATSDLVDWSDQALFTTGRELTAFQRDRKPEHLDEALVGAQVLLAITQEIARREVAAR